MQLETSYKITPTRGTCIELGSALVIIAGRLKIPINNTLSLVLQ